MADLTTLLSKFLNDLYAGALGVTNAITSIGVGAGSVSAPSYNFSTDTNTGLFQHATGWVDITTDGTAAIVFNSTQISAKSTAQFGWSAGDPSVNGMDLVLVRDAANTLAQKNGTAASQAYRQYGYVSGSRSTYGALQCITEAVTLSGATTDTAAIIPAGATVEMIATTTTTTITGASGYQVGDASDADRYGDKTGTAVGTNTGSADYTADPRWWTNAARAVRLTAKTSNFTGGVVQVTVFYRTATGA